MNQIWRSVNPGLVPLVYERKELNSKDEDDERRADIDLELLPVVHELLLLQQF